MEIKLQPSEMSASGLSGNSLSQGKKKIIIYLFQKKIIIGRCKSDWFLTYKVIFF